MSSTAYPPFVAYPLSVRGFFDQPGRALWLVKWLLLIPHYIILVFLWLAFWIVTVIAFFAILFTTRYPKGLFDFNVGVIRWSWRVSFYGYAALGTDRYPPFTLADVPDYPARLDLEYPQQLNRWLPLVKWLLAFPQYILVGAFVGSGYVVATTMQDGRAVTYSTPSLIGACVLIAAIALLFTTRYPPGLFDLAVGIDRWGYRLLVYVALMTDRYPPFRLDQGSIDIEGPPQPRATSEAWQVEQPPGYGPEAERGQAIELGPEGRLQVSSLRAGIETGSQAASVVEAAVTEVEEYAGYAHLLPAQKGWEQIADDALAWAVEHAR